MKKFLVTLGLVFGTVCTAQAQVYFDSGSDRPNNPHAARHQIHQQHRAHPRERLVRCRDGARRVARMCRGHGGVARRR